MLSLSLSQGPYVGTGSRAGNRPKVSICLLVLLTLMRERASQKETERNPVSRGGFLAWHNMWFCSVQTFGVLMVIHRGKYVCFLSVLSVAVPHTHTLWHLLSHTCSYCVSAFHGLCRSILNRPGHWSVSVTLTPMRMWYVYVHMWITCVLVCMCS